MEFGNIVIVNCANSRVAQHKPSAAWCQRREAEIAEAERLEAEREATAARRQEARGRITADPKMKDLAEAMGWL